MKRTPLKRGTKRLCVRKPLNRSRPEWTTKVGIRQRKPLRKVGRRARAARKVVSALRDLICEAQCGRCARCDRRRKLDMHHLLSKARGGTNDRSNLVGLCRSCHDEITFSNPVDQLRWVLSAKGSRP